MTAIVLEQLVTQMTLSVNKPAMVVSCARQSQATFANELHELGLHVLRLIRIEEYKIKEASSYNVRLTEIVAKLLPV